MVFGLLPHDFDRVKFRTVGRQVHQQQAMIDQPIVELFRVDAVMNGGVVQHDDRQRQPWCALGDTVDQCHDGVAADGLRVQIMPEVPRGIVQRAHDIDPLAREAGICRVWFAFRVPSTLHVGDIAETAFVQIKQADFAGARGFLTLFQVDAGRFEPLPAASFFKDSRVRVNARPRARKPADKRSRLKSGASG